jgi:hypothetical protein
MRSWWLARSQPVKNLLLFAFADLFLLLGALLGVPGLRHTWEVLTSYMPNLYEPLLSLAVHGVRLLWPGAAVLSAVQFLYVTLFLTLLTIHLPIAFAVGFLLKHRRTPVHRFVEYALVIAILFVLHWVLILTSVLQ